MSDTATKTRDFDAAVEALKAQYGNFVLFNARTKPIDVTNVVLAAWDVDSVESTTAKDHLPNFVGVHGPIGIVQEVDRFYGLLPAPFDQDRADVEDPGPDVWLSDELDAAYEFAAAAPPADPILDVFAEGVDPVEERPADPALVDLTSLQAPPVTEYAPPAAKPKPAAYDEITLVQLRKGSRGHLSGGYSLKRDELVKALIKAGVTPEQVKANQA